MLLFYTSRIYEGSKKATGWSKLLHNWPFNTFAWLCGTIGLILTGIFCFAAFEVAFLIAFVLCLVFLWYAIIHKKAIEKKIILALYRDCPEIFDEDEAENLKRDTKGGINEVIVTFKKRHNNYI